LPGDHERLDEESREKEKDASPRKDDAFSTRAFGEARDSEKRPNSAYGVRGVRGVCANDEIRDEGANERERERYAYASSSSSFVSSFFSRADLARASRRGARDAGGPLESRDVSRRLSVASDASTSHSGLSWYRRASASAAATTREPGDISRREAKALRFAAVDPSRRALRRCAAVEAGERHNSGLLDSGLLRAASGGDEPDADGDASDATPRLASVARRTPRTPSTRTVPRETPKGPGGVLFSLSSFLDAVKVVALARRQSPENSGDRDDPP
jgi:hypothetical protein